MIAAVIDTALARPWAAVAAATHPLPTTTTTNVAVPLAATAPVVTTTADAHRLVSLITGVREGMVAPHHVVAWEVPMSMVHRALATLTILTMPGPDHHPVATTIRT